MDIKKDIRFRVYVAFICICLLGLAVIIKAASIQMKEGAELQQLAYNAHMKTDTMYAERGNIYTEGGDLLCSSIPQFDIHLDPSVVKRDTFRKYIDTLSRGIAAILGDKSAAAYKAELLQAYSDSDHYYELCKNIAYDRYIPLSRLPVFRLGKRRGGFIVDEETKRTAPYSTLARRTIGLWRKNAPSVGLEATYDSLLRGANGSRILQKMSGGVYMPVEGTEYEPQDGEDIVTTLDLNIQSVAEFSLMSVLKQYNCLYGTAIVMEVQTGKIRALVNLGYDSASQGYTEKQNYALTPAEPGSTFKLVTLMSLLKDGLINVEDEVDCQGGAIKFGNRVMRDSHLGLGRLSIRDAYAHSSNAAMAWLAFSHYSKEPRKWLAHLDEFGVGKRTGIDIAGEPRPRVVRDTDKEWSSASLPWQATGYGVIITPLRTCMLYNGIANGGRMMKPYLLSSIRKYGKEVAHIEPTAVMEKMCDSGAVSQLQACMREVVLSGTATHIRSPFYGIAGKTGTAQVADKIEGRWYPYSAGIYQGSFVGFFPTDKPKYTICVVIRTKPHAGSYYGGLLAAPVFRMISDKIFASGLGSWKGPLDSLSGIRSAGMSGKAAKSASYQQMLVSLGIKAMTEAFDRRSLAQVVADSSRNLSLKEKPVVKGLVPDVSRMGLRDAVYLLESAGLQVELRGRGTVQSQSIAPGSGIIKGQSILIQLS